MDRPLPFLGGNVDDWPGVGAAGRPLGIELAPALPVPPVPPVAAEPADPLVPPLVWAIAAVPASSRSPAIIAERLHLPMHGCCMACLQN